MDLARGHYPRLTQYFDDEMLQKCKINYEAVNRLDARHRFTEQTESNLLS